MALSIAFVANEFEYKRGAKHNVKESLELWSMVNLEGCVARPLAEHSAARLVGASLSRSGSSSADQNGISNSLSAKR